MGCMGRGVGYMYVLYDKKSLIICKGEKRGGGGEILVSGCIPCYARCCGFLSRWCVGWRMLY